MWKNHLIVAMRNIVRHKGYTFINIIGLSLALTCCLLLGILVHYELNFDRFHANANRIELLAHKEILQTGEQIQDKQMAPLAPQLKQDVAGIAEYVRTFDPDVTLSCEEKSTQEGILCADENFFEVFSFPLLQGDSTRVLREPHSIVLSEAAAKRWFGDTSAIGRTLTLEGALPLTVTGVMQDIPGNSTIRTDYVVPFRLLKEAGFEIDKWMGNDYATYLLLDENAPRDRIAGDINQRCHELLTAANLKEKRERTWFLQSLTRLHLYGLGGQEKLIDTVYIVIAVALILLLTACINFVNITTARSMTRAREVGIRKVFGAGRMELVAQFMGEAGLQVVGALALAVAVAEITLPAFGRLVGIPLTWQVASLPAVCLLVLLVFGISILAGLYPAAHFSAYRPTAILRRETTGRRAFTVRRILVVTQFTLAVILTVGAIVVARQMNYIMTKDLGFDRDALVGFQATDGIKRNFESFRQELLKNANVQDVSVAVQNVANVNSSLGPNVDWEGKNPSQSLEMHFDWVSYDYAPTLGLDMAQGRFYSREFPADTIDGIVLNESAIALMGITDPIGKRFNYWGKQKRIIGVAKDFFFQPLRETLKPMVLIYGAWGSIIYVRVSSTDNPETMARIEAIAKKYDPTAVITCRSFDQVNELNYVNERRMMQVAQYAVILSVIIACLGLFGLSALVTEQRTKEVGIRKVLGASRFAIVRLVLRESLLLVGSANVIAWPLSYIIAGRFLQHYAYRVGIGLMPFVIAAMLAIAAAAIAVGYHAVRAATLNPVDSLKYE